MNHQIWQFKGWSWTATAPAGNQTFGILPLHFGPTQGCQKYDGFQGCWMEWWAHQSSNLSHMHQFILKGCSSCCSDTGSEGYKVVNYPVNMQTTKSNQLRVPQITLGTCSWTNKGHFPVRLYSHSSRGTEVAMTEGRWLLKRSVGCTAAKKSQMISLKLVCAPPYIPPTFYVSITTETSLNDVTIICFPLLMGNTLRSRVMLTCLRITLLP